MKFKLASFVLLIAAVISGWGLGPVEGVGRGWDKGIAGVVIDRVSLHPSPLHTIKRGGGPSSSSPPTTTTSSSSSSSSTSQKKKKKKKRKKKRKRKRKKKTPTSPHLSTPLSPTSSNYRLQSELRNFLTSPPPDLTVSVGRNLRIWHVKISGRNIYEGSTFTLRIKYPPLYPSVPPSVYFVGPVIPEHEHVYSNGDICLSLLGSDWTPNLTGMGIAVSVQSILKSARRKSRPVDNSGSVGRKPGESQKDWIYHDDNC